MLSILWNNRKMEELSPSPFRRLPGERRFSGRSSQRRFSDRIKVIFHLGACSSTTEEDISYLIRNNFEYSKSLAGYCRENDIRFIYASSAATYGDGSAGYSDESGAVPSLRPLNGYAFSKQLFDLWALKNGLFDSIVGLKYFNVFGPNEYHKGDMRSMVCKGYQQIKETDKIRLFMSYRHGYRDGGQQRDFVYVKDAVDMTIFCYDNPSLRGLYNIGSGAPHTWNTLAAAIFGAMEKKPQIQYISMPDELKNKYQYYTRADLSRLRAAGYKKPITPLRDAVRDYVQNYLDRSEYLTL